ncbi:hypothetical protein [Streptomyces pseudogriseolus]|uniref:hypothetical protein n=1 Tax=Streptomyces pseudogriseolus TaxID=36817 RepID=UPI00347C2DC4
MSTDFDSFSNRGEYLSAHYFAEQLADGLKKGVFAVWADRESDENDERTTPRVALRGLRSVYLDEKFRGFFAEQAKADAEDDEHPDKEGFEERLNTYEDEEWCERLVEWHRKVLTALGYPGADAGTGPRELTVHRAGRDHTVKVAWHGDGIVAVDCGWSASNDTALDADGYGRLLHPLRTVGNGETYESGQALATWLFQSELGGEGGSAPRFVLLLCGGVIVLADRQAWGEGRYLAANLDAALERYDRRQTGELATIAGLFSHDALAPAEDGKGPAIDALVKASRDNAVGVSGDLRQGLQKSVEIIANEVLARLEETGLEPRDLEKPGEPFARQLTREALRYLYRILFLLYAEARPELGILPADDGTYEAGYSVARLREIVERDTQLTDETARNGTHLHDSLDLLFNKVNYGHREYGTEPWDEQDGDDAETRKKKAKQRSEGRGLRFEPLRSELFEPAAVRLIGLGTRDPRRDEDSPEGPAWLDLRLRNSALHEVLRLLTMKKAKRRGERGGFISYRNLGINQLGAVYEGLMSYTGIIAEEELSEVAKGGDPEKGSWLVPSHRLKEYDEKTWVQYDERDREEKGLRGPKKYPAGTFVYRLAGRDRETSASYYTPESLTKVTVELALKHRLDQEKDEAGNVIKTRASELLKYRICEPALGSGAFLNEAINQVAEEYLRRRQDELGRSIPTAQALTEKQKVKAYIALHNAYGVDLNRTGVELAEVSLWLNTMHPGMRAPWFGLHLRRGNSLIGGRRAVYAAEDVSPQKGKPRWLVDKDTLAPTRLPFRDNEAGGRELPLPDGAVHQFLVPTPGWAAVTRAGGDAKKLLGQLAGDGVEQLKEWKKGILQKPERKYTQAGTPRIDRKTGDEAASQYTRLRDAARRAEFLWKLVVKRMELSEREIARSIDVWEADPKDEEFAFLRRAENGGATRLSKEKVYADLFNAVDTPYWRLKQVMDAWCALWFWPVDKVGLLDGTDAEYAAESVDVEELLGGFGEPATLQVAPEEVRPSSEPAPAPAVSKPAPRFAQAGLLFQMAGDQPSLDDADMEAEGDYFYEVQKAGGVPKQRKKPTSPAPKRRRPVIPLKDLNDWLDFLESMLGVGPVPDGSIGSGLDNLKDLGEYEKLLLDEMWMDRTDPEARYPWMGVVREIAEEQGFLHWELEFALAFTEGGGFDLQVGNPPWVRPDWKEDSVLAESDPWFTLTENSDERVLHLRREQVLAKPSFIVYVCREIENVVTLSSFLKAPQNYSLISGSRPDLYRGFVCQTWRHASSRGIVGLIHPDTHFEGEGSGPLREAAYRRLAVHGSFINGKNWAFEASRTLEFGVHIYRAKPGDIDFAHVSHLYSASALIESFLNDGKGEIPGVKYRGGWDTRPHRARIVQVNPSLLAVWDALAGGDGVDLDRTPLKYPVSSAENAALLALARFERRLGVQEIDGGLNETMAERSGLIRESVESPGDWCEVILKGPQIGVATPIAKQPPNMKNNDQPWYLPDLPCDAVPATVYVRAVRTRKEFVEAQRRRIDPAIHRQLKSMTRKEISDRYGADHPTVAGFIKGRGAVENLGDALYEELLCELAKRPFSEYYRLAWREMIPDNGERSLFCAIIPPGPTHVHAVRSVALENNRLTALQAGFWASLVLDYYLRATGRAHLDVADAKSMPFADPDHPLAQALLLRSLRLNCVTSAYTDLWSELFDSRWGETEGWARAWSHVTPIERVSAHWSSDIPLRSEYARRAALVEIDALVAVWLGISADGLIAAYRSRYGTMSDYEEGMYFDTQGRRIASRFEVYGYTQARTGRKKVFEQLEEHLNSPEACPAPDGYTAPFYKADRETEMREAHAYFQKRLDDAVAAGKWDPVKQEVPKP